MQATMNIRQFTYEIFDGVANTANIAGSYITESFKSKKQEATNIQPEQALEQAPPQAPTFSAEELEVARNLAREEGISQGYDQAKKQFEERQAAADTRLGELVNNLGAEIQRISGEVETRKNLLSRDFADLALSLAKQICENLPEATLTVQLESLIKESLATLDEGQKIKITVNPKNAAELNGKFTGVELKTAEELAPGDFRIEWQNGYLERDTKKLWGNMEQILSKHFATTETTEENNPSVEQTEENKLEQGE